jgi:hypothetical protein
MIKGDITPSRVFMARRTVFVRVILRIQHCCMNIFMAVAAGFTDLPEFPSVVFPVTIEAGSGQVGPTKDKG